MHDRLFALVLSAVRTVAANEIPKLNGRFAFGCNVAGLRRCQILRPDTALATSAAGASTPVEMSKCGKALVKKSRLIPIPTRPPEGEPARRCRDDQRAHGDGDQMEKAGGDLPAQPCGYWPSRAGTRGCWPLREGIGLLKLYSDPTPASPPPTNS